MKKLIPLLAISLVAGCAHKPPVQSEQPKPIQQNLLAKCPPLSKHEGTTGAAVIRTMTLWAAEYNECANRHNLLVESVK